MTKFYLVEESSHNCELGEHPSWCLLEEATTSLEEAERDAAAWLQKEGAGELSGDTFRIIEVVAVRRVRVSVSSVVDEPGAEGGGDE